MNQKKTESSGRKITTPLFMLRAVELGISVRDLDYLSVGMVMDMFTEKINDAQHDENADVREATQKDIDNF